MTLTYNDIDYLAKNFTDRYYKNHPNDIAINAEILLKEQLNMDTEFYTLSDDFSILGLWCNFDAGIEVLDKGKPVIVPINKHKILIERRVKELDCYGRLQFTIAHEGAHQIIYDLSKGCNGKRIYYRKRSEADWFEWQADTLAACLLMPRDKVYDIFIQMFPQGTIAFYSPLNFELHRSMQIMATLFGVSVQALVKRLHHLGLIKQYDFANKIAS